MVELLTYVTGEIKASMRAEVFATDARPGAGWPADPQAYLWRTDSAHVEPALILRSRDHPLSAAA